MKLTPRSPNNVEALLDRELGVYADEGRTAGSRPAYGDVRRASSHPFMVGFGTRRALVIVEWSAKKIEVPTHPEASAGHAAAGCRVAQAHGENEGSPGQPHDVS
jgi:hypothetical protein